MIIVTGATGNLGHAIVEKLVGRIPAKQVGVSVRDPAKATRLKALGVRVRHGDFDKPESLRLAFEGAAQVLMVSSNAAAYGGNPLAQHRSAIEAARAAGARRIVYTSHMGASDTSAFPPMRDHYATEDILRQSGLAWTALRNGFYASSGFSMMGDAFKTGIVDAPVDGKVSWTAHADLAEAAAIILANEGRYNGPYAAPHRAAGAQSCRSCRHRVGGIEQANSPTNDHGRGLAEKDGSAWDTLPGPGHCARVVYCQPTWRICICRSDT